MVRIASTLVLASVYVVAATALIEEKLSDAASTIASAVDSPPRRPEDIDYAPSKSESSGSDGTDFSNADDYDPDWGTVVGPFGQCGGDDYDGPTECVKDWTCYDVREGYSQCIPDTSVAIIQSSQQTPEPTTPCPDEPEPTSPCTDEPVSATPCPDEPVPTSPCPDEPVSDTPSPVSSQEPDATLTPAPSSTDAPAPTTAEPDTSEPPVTETPPPTTEEPATDAPTTEEPVTTEEPTTGPAPVSPEPTTDTPVVTPVDPTPEPTQDTPAVPTEEPAPTTPPPALIGAWQQCGGMDFDQSKAGLECVAGYQCDTINDYYSQCVPRHEPGHVSFWAQCGGEGFSGVTSCTSGSTCTYFNQWYSQCVPEEEA